MRLFSRRIYLDYAASTPLSDGARRAYLRAARLFGNPSAIHREGTLAKRALEDARAALARALSVKAQSIVFTGGGTEANNLAIIGLAHALFREGVSYEHMHFVTLSIEHPSVLECMRELERRGASVSYLPVDEEGLVSPEAVAAALKDETVLVSIAHVNSEIGVIQPLKEIAESLKARRTSSLYRSHQGWDAPYLHTDASQSPLYLECSPHALQADMVTVDAQKLHGPKGVGALVLSRFIPLAPVAFGGSQERALRPGTENLAAIAAFAAAYDEAARGREGARVRLSALRDYFFDEIGKRVPGVLVNGSRTRRIANNVNVSLLGRDAEYLAVLLDERGIACATKSACLGAEGDGSHVARSLGGDATRAKSSLRFTLGKETTKADINRAIEILSRIVVLPAARLVP